MHDWSVRDRLLFHLRIRPEKKFASREELQEQIGRDVEAVRAHFRHNSK